MSNVFQALRRAKGLGSGHNGTHHFIAQRVVGILLIPLIFYFIYAFISLAGIGDYAALKMWFKNPFNLSFALLFFVLGFYQAALGIQVILEDYVHHEVLKWISLILVRGLCLLFAVVAIVSLLRMAFA